MKKEQGGIVDYRGIAAGGVTVTVYDHGTLDLSDIYSDEGITPQANPFNADSVGRWSFYVANGRYDIKFSGTGITTYLLEDVIIEEFTAANAVSIQGHDVNEAALGDDKILVYKVAGDEFVYEDKGVPIAHAASHENAGGDEISVAGLSGLLADDQNPVAHHADHENAGGDEISVAGLSGLLADDQNPVAHHADHENAGGDEISVAGLSGVLADKQDADHIQGHTVNETDIGNDKVLVYKNVGDQFVYEAKGTPSLHAASHENAGGDEISLAGLSGSPADVVITAGRSGGQTIIGGTDANDDLLFTSTSDGTKGMIGTTDPIFYINGDYAAGDEDAILDFNNTMAQIKLEYLGAESIRHFTMTERLNITAPDVTSADFFQSSDNISYALRLGITYDVGAWAEVGSWAGTGLYIQLDNQFNESDATKIELAVGEFQGYAIVADGKAAMYGVDVTLVKQDPCVTSNLFCGVSAILCSDVDPSSITHGVGLRAFCGDHGAYTSVRQYVGLLIYGDRGWKYPIRAIDTDGATDLFWCDQYGSTWAGGLVYSTYGFVVANDIGAGQAGKLIMVNDVTDYVDGTGSQAPKGVTGAGNPTFAGWWKIYDEANARYVPIYSAIQ